VPLSDSLTIEGTLVHDSMSGASPLHHDTLSGASGLGITDYRAAADAKLTKYFGSTSLAIGGAYSHERDFISGAASVEWRAWSDDRNPRFALLFVAPSDRNDPLTGP
jgi:hypothetical protein